MTYNYVNMYYNSFHVLERIFFLNTLLFVNTTSINFFDFYYVDQKQLDLLTL